MSAKTAIFITTELFDDVKKYSKIRLEDFPHCANNTKKIYGDLFCPKCRVDTKVRIRRWQTTKQLHSHLVRNHIDDRTQKPTLDSCISWLQVISDSISSGLLK